MRRTHVLTALALVALVATSGCLGAIGQTDAQTTNGDDDRTVSVSATGEVSAAADEAVVSVAVVATGDTAETARERLAENVTRLREGLAEAGVADDRITTSGYDIGQDHRPREKGQAETRYVARQSFQVTLNDTDRAGEVIDVAVGSGATRVDGVRFTLSRDRQDELQREALVDAMDRARSKAETLAGASNMTIVEATTVTSTNGIDRPVYAEATAVADAGGATKIDGGPVRVTASVEVTYAASS